MHLTDVPRDLRGAIDQVAFDRAVGRIAQDQLAIRVAGRHRRVTRRIVARIDDIEVGTDGDRIVHFDVIVVDRHAETRNEVRLPHKAKRLGVGLFRRQVRVAAKEGIHLA